MTTRHLSPVLLAAVALGLAGATSSAPAPAAMTAPTQRNLSVQTTTLASASYAPTINGYARVIDAVPLATLDSDLAAALAAAAASQAEAVRARALNAEDQMVATKVAEWGPAVARLSDGQRGRLVQALASGGAALVRIDAATPVSGGGLVVLDLGPAGIAQARILGPARTADPRLQSAGRLALVSGSRAQYLSTGLAVPVRIPAGATLTGVIAPDSAVLRAEGQSWVFVRTGPERFERRVLVQPVPMQGGLFVSSGLRTGEVVATRGASALYAAEQAGG